MGLAVWTRELFQTWGLAPEDDRAPRPETCVFCAKVAEAEKDPSAFAYVDAEIVVFRDWKPAARAHFLVCPRKHITSARALTHRDAGLARRMLDVGERVVGDARAAARADEKKNQDDTERGTGTGTRFGYHLPPFNSVDHLHMHAFALPFEPAWKERKYSVEPWARFAFEPAGETAHRLERERDARGTKTNTENARGRL
jgi:diadenosine tetraphosphate (Ap4A) HIT family hydrolase